MSLVNTPSPFFCIVCLAAAEQCGWASQRFMRLKTTTDHITQRNTQTYAPALLRGIYCRSRRSTTEYSVTWNQTQAQWQRPAQRVEGGGGEQLIKVMQHMTSGPTPANRSVAPETRLIQYHRLTVSPPLAVRFFLCTEYCLCEYSVVLLISLSFEYS